MLKSVNSFTFIFTNMQSRAEGSDENSPVRVTVKKVERGQWPITLSRFRVTASRDDSILAEKEGLYINRRRAKREIREIWKSEGKIY